MEVEHRLDRAFQVLWEKLEALLFPSPHEKEPETHLRTHPSKVKRKPVQTPRAPQRLARQNQPEILRKRETGGLSGGSKRRATATWELQGIVMPRKHRRAGYLRRPGRAAVETRNKVQGTRAATPIEPQKGNPQRRQHRPQCGEHSHAALSKGDTLLAISVEECERAAPYNIILQDCILTRTGIG
ncbi:Hypothetical predicted protein [Pelobates cultripes]|uniref:Uncharacterized protein n=1 Tax=Pelobates cultripes TaxID=61616 RepID=A0AAD1VU24_PELCU|nr:Hypothetical predicted protein [Pelobates cultripes]